MEMKSYTLEEIDSHVQPLLSGSQDVVPLNPLRLQSYLNNPRAEKTDPLLFELQIDGKLVAYRTLLPDCFYNAEGHPQRFAWLSGNYVDPQFRRQGFSTKLLQMVEAHWEGRLMYTNYAPASKAVYDQTGQYPVYTRRDGKRFYLRAASRELLSKRVGFRNMLRLGDALVNRLREGKLQRFLPVDHSQCLIENITKIDDELARLVDRSLESSLFRRDSEVLNWILESPWVTAEQVNRLNYPFSYQVERFENVLLKFTLPGSKGTGMMWLVIQDRKLSVPYLFADSDDLYSPMARTVLHTMISLESAYCTLRHPQLVQQLLVYKKWFLSVRNMPQWIFVHKNMAPQVPSDLFIHDGDGDVAFTG